MFVCVGGNMPKWPDISVDDDIWSVQYLYKLFLIPDDGVSSIDSYHQGVLDNSFVTALLAEEGCHKYARGPGPSILFFSIENLAGTWFYCHCVNYFLSLGIWGVAILQSLFTNLDLLELEQRTTREIKGADPQQTYSDVSIIKVATPTLEQISVLSLVGDGGCWVAWF